MPLNLPNALTWLRILLIPVFVLFYYLPEAWMERKSVNMLAAGVFLLASLTDWLDGYLARKLNQMSAFGAFLDPVADKLMVAAALIVLVDLGRAAPLVAVIIIIVTGLTLAFGDTSGGFRRLIQIVFGLSIAFAASSFFLSFFSFGGGVTI